MRLLNDQLSTAGPSYTYISGLSSFFADDIDRDLNRRARSPVLEPVRGVPVLGPAHSRPIVRGDPVAMVSDRSLQYVDDAWSVFVIVNRTEDASGLDGHHTHTKLPPCHAFDLRAKVNRCQQLRRDTSRLRCLPVVLHPALLSIDAAPLSLCVQLEGRDAHL